MLGKLINLSDAYAFLLRSSDMDYLPLLLFIVSTSITPGPNNMMIMSSGVNYGFRKSIPHLIGIDTGFPLMLVAIGLGFHQLFELYPALFDWIKIVGIAYLSYMAYKIITAPVTPLESREARPFSFMQAFFFQWVNPKAWVMCVGAVATFVVADHNFLLQVVSIALLYVVFGTPCTVTWLWFGTKLQKFLSDPAKLRLFNWLMGALLFVSLLPSLFEIWA